MTSLLKGGLAAVLVVAACAGQVAASDLAELEAAQATWEKAFAAGDGAAAAEAVFTEDARLLPPDGPVIEGRAAIAEFWQGAWDAGVNSLNLGVIAVEVNGGTMIETGTWTVKAPGEDGAEAEFSGNALVIWKKGEDGAWRMSQDMWNDGS